MAFNQKIYRKNYRIKHKDSLKESSRKYYCKNKFKWETEKFKENVRRWNKEHKEQCNNCNKAWTKRQNKQYREQIRIYKREWRHKLGISKKFISKYGGPKPLTSREHRLLRKYNMKKAGLLTIETIQRVYEDNIKKYGTLTCVYCNNPVEFKQDSLEHKQPLSREGTNEYHNLAIACRKCNSSKGKKTEEEYRKEILSYGTNYERSQ
ncbi:hypothetical protein LCGC14_2705320 [marine sediment metagenome]|uniref:HNH nuclease domain-containing protein n=1 Tax=marine sediment metagenome TaxID=412755 RepID=A0A0F8ZEE6_9ZZZZ|nr:HNH endonuclease [Candidatus Scalindua sp.]